MDFRLDLGNAIIEEHLPDVDPNGPASLPSPPRLQGGTRHAARETPRPALQKVSLVLPGGEAEDDTHHVSRVSSVTLARMAVLKGTIPRGGYNM